jgi:hypothetical protein
MTLESGHDTPDNHDSGSSEKSIPSYLFEELLPSGLSSSQRFVQSRVAKIPLPCEPSEIVKTYQSNQVIYLDVAGGEAWPLLKPYHQKGQDDGIEYRFVIRTTDSQYLIMGAPSAHWYVDSWPIGEDRFVLFHDRVFHCDPLRIAKADRRFGWLAPEHATELLVDQGYGSELPDDLRDRLNLEQKTKSSRKASMTDRQSDLSPEAKLSEAPALTDHPDEPSPSKASPEAPLDLVTLDQAAGMVHKSKRTLERFKTEGTLPPPVVEGGGGKADLYDWKDMRPWLTKQFGIPLPEKFPRNRLS